MKKHLFAAIILFAPSIASARPHHTPKVSLETAEATALAKVPGKIKEHELEKEKGRWIWSFDIKADGEKRKHMITEVNVDSDTGEIVDVSSERE